MHMSTKNKRSKLNSSNYPDELTAGRDELITVRIMFYLRIEACKNYSCNARQSKSLSLIKDEMPFSVGIIQ